MRKLFVIASAILSVPLISNCGGGSSSANTSAAPATNTSTPAQFEGGIWQGTFAQNGVTTQILALASPDGQFYSENVNENNDCATISTGTVTVTGSTVTGSLSSAIVEYSSSPDIQTGCVFTDNSTWASGALSGTLGENSSLSLTTQLTTADGTTLPSESGALTFNSLYNESSSLSKIAGNWTGTTGDVATISSNGQVYAQEAASGCVVNGQYSVINASYNVYSLSATYGDCTGSASVLNGQTATGLVTLNDSVTPNELEGGGSVSLANGTIIVVIASATRSGEGGSTSFSLGGTISGLSASGLTLENDGVSLGIASGATRFTFPQSIESGTGYAVTVGSQPTGETCIVSNGTGTVQASNIVSVSVSCGSDTTPTYTVGGSISGLAQGNVVLTVNGSSALTINANATSFVFSSAFASGASYSVSVSTQPADQTCTVTHASGTVSSDVTNIAVNCTTDTFTVGGTISGLSASGLVLQDNGASREQVASGTTTFTLPALATGSTYNVTIESQPSTEVCTVANGSGTMGSANIIDVAISCVKTYSIGGTVAGLTASGLVLQDNGADSLSISGNGIFTFRTEISSGANYTVTVFAQPSGQTCTTSDSSGTLANTNVTNVTVSCTNNVVISPFEGLWSGPTTNTTAGYPGFIVDANGVYWAEQVGWDVGAISGMLSATPTAGVYAASPNQSSHGYDTLVLNTATASGGVLTIDGTFTGNCVPTGGCSDGYQEEGVFPWTYQGTLEVASTPAPIASLAGNWTTTWGSALTINSDGSFVLTDNSGASYNTNIFQPSGCTYTGQIALYDPTQNIYSVTATVTSIPDWNTGDACSGTAQGVFTLLNGQLAGGLADSAGDFSVMDTVAP
ncbi:MAG TPA: hypothetical protein VHY19_06895 [Steroidobacteraceae bacterium]|jgi:hypothetical protein|nr:hypothetical protein [Steroidobacteraceae bacterium]